MKKEKDIKGMSCSLPGTYDPPRTQRTAIGMSQDLRHCRENCLGEEVTS